MMKLDSETRADKRTVCTYIQCCARKRTTTTTKQHKDGNFDLNNIQRLFFLQTHKCSHLLQVGTNENCKYIILRVCVLLCEYLSVRMFVYIYIIY